MILMERSVSRSYLLVFQLLLILTLSAAYYLHPSHLLKRKLVYAVCLKCDNEVLQYLYLEDKKRDLKILLNYPIIKKLLVQCNTALPSSAPVEKLFSFAGIITGSNRDLSDKIFEQFLLLTDNE